MAPGEETLPPEEGGPADPDGAWFGEARAEPAGPPTLGVREVGERIADALQRAFPARFWVAGETSDWERSFAKSRQGHWYFRLLDEEQGGDPRKRASIKVKMWSSTVRRLYGPLAGTLDPADGIVLRALVSADFYAPHGEISLTIENLDPAYTLGDFDRQRRELLERLKAEGSEQLNGALPLPEVPLRIGLVTAEGSAAYHDILDGLTGSGFGFQVLFCDARMQGAQTGPSVCAALAALAARRPDVIVLARGGGSRLDLSWFDREDIARAVATCPVPVLTGIGHEIDTAVVDVVAHTAFKTPTAVAEFLAGLAREGAEYLEATAQAVLGRAGEQLDAERETLLVYAQRLPSAARRCLRGGATALRALAQDLARAAQGCLHAGLLRLEGLRARLARGPHTEGLQLRRQAVGSAAARLRALASTRLQRDLAALEGAAQRTRLLDPRRVLARGYAYLLGAGDGLVKGVAAVRPGDALTAVLAGGRLDLLTREVHPQASTEGSGPHPAGEGGGDGHPAADARGGDPAARRAGPDG